MAGSICRGKLSWPELKGTKGKVAAKVIEKQNPNVHAMVLPEGSPVSSIFSCGRVVVAVNHKGIVVNTPRVG